MTGLIDADRLLYLSKETDTIHEAINRIDYNIENIVLKSELNNFIIILSDSKNFRKELYQDYKSNRSKLVLPKFKKTIKSYLYDVYGAISFDYLEADDIIAYHKKKEPLTTIISNDKDLLYCIEGEHINPSKKISEGLYDQVKVTTTKDEAYVNWWKSMICGDATDSIKGVEGKGEAYFNKIIESVDLKNIPSVILNAYIAKYGELGLFNFGKNYTLLKLIDSDEELNKYNLNIELFKNVIHKKDIIKDYDDNEVLTISLPEI